MQHLPCWSGLIRRWSTRLCSECVTRQSRFLCLIVYLVKVPPMEACKRIQDTPLLRGLSGRKRGFFLVLFRHVESCLPILSLLTRVYINHTIKTAFHLLSWLIITYVFQKNSFLAAWGHLSGYTDVKLTTGALRLITVLFHTVSVPNICSLPHMNF